MTQKEEPVKMAIDDAELNAMAEIAKVLEGVTPEAQGRVLAWVNARFGVRTDQIQLRGGAGVRPSSPGPGEFVDLYDAANPDSETERALVAAYWFQVVEGTTELDAQTLNNALKNLGNGVSNITSALSRAQHARPALVRQVLKSGRTRQARKKYRLTTEGIRFVEGLMAQHGGEHDIMSVDHEERGGHDND